MRDATPFRKEILAQLHINRARLFKSMVGLPTSTLEQPLWDDYSIRRILPHIARCDGFEAERLSLINAGRLNEIEQIPVDKQNAAWHLEHADITIDGGVAMISKERNGLLNVLENVPDDILKATVTLSGDFQLSVLSCVTNSIEHDADHDEDIQAWRKASEMERQQSGPRSILVAALKAACRGLQALFELVGDAPIAVDSWRREQVLAHITGWEQHSWESLQSGKQVQAYATEDEANAAYVRVSAEKSFSEIWQQYATTRKKIERYAATADITATSFATASGNIISPYRFICLNIAHDVEHIEEFYSAYLANTRLKK